MPAVPRLRKPAKLSVANLAGRAHNPSQAPGLGLIQALAAHMAAQHQQASMSAKTAMPGAQSNAFQGLQLRQSTQNVNTMPNVGGM